MFGAGSATARQTYRNPSDSQKLRTAILDGRLAQGCRTGAGTGTSMTDISRRDFVRAGVIAGAAAGATKTFAHTQAPAVKVSSARPVVIASGNGNRFQNGGDRTCVEEAFRLLVEWIRSHSTLLIAGVNIVELDPEDTSVGYGGLPNADASSCWMPAACTARRSKPEAWPHSKAFVRRRSSRKP